MPRGTPDGRRAGFAPHARWMLLSWVAFLIAGAIATPARCCQVPVFRFALERWEADDYRVVVFERGPRSDGTQALIGRLQQASRHAEGGTGGHANLVVEIADIDNLTDAQQWSLPGWEDFTTFPAVQVYYPASTGEESAFWQGELTDAAIDRLLESPARLELIQRLTSGDSAVWVLVETGNEAVDTAAENKLRSLLDAAQAELKIPDGVIRPEELEAALNAVTREAPVEMDDVLRSRIPLRIAFSILRLDPASPEEAVFARMLGGAEPQPFPGVEPVAIAVFGRGRMMPPIAASRFAVETIAGATGYLCGACSCQVKEQNPGRDLLVGADWSQHLQDGLIVSERALPPLSGAGDLTATEPAALAMGPGAAADRKPATFAPATLWVSVMAAAAAVAAGSVVLLRRMRADR